MIISKFIHYVFLGLPLLVISSSCLDKTENEEEIRIEQYRKVVSHYVEKARKSSRKDLPFNEIQSEDPNEKILNRLTYLNLSAQIKEEVAIGEIEEYIHKETFEQFHPLVKFYAYYYLSQKYFNQLSIDRALQTNIKAYSYIENDIEHYDIEKAKIKALLHSITLTSKDDKQEIINSNLEKLARLEPLNDSTERFFTLEELAWKYYEIQDYNNSKKYITIALRDYENNTHNNILAIDYAILANNYAKLNQIDSLQWMNDKIERKYEMGEFQNEHWLTYLLLTLEQNIGRIEKNELQKTFDFVFQQYPDNCSFRRQWVEIYRNYSLFLQSIHKLYLEKEILRKSLQKIEDCEGVMDAHLVEEKKRILGRLISIDLKYGYTKPLLKRIRERQELNEQRSKHFDKYYELTEYLSKHDLMSVENDVEKQKEIRYNSLKLSLLYFVISVVFLFFALYILKLYLKNKKYSRYVRNNAKLIKVQNQNIEEKNLMLNSIVDQLQERNEGLQNFARVAAHDIKSPISSIQMATQYLVEKYAIPTQKNKTNSFSKIHEETIKLNAMINELLHNSIKRVQK